MSRDQLVRALRKYAREREMPFKVETKRGKGSQYRVRVEVKVTTVQKDLNPAVSNGS